MEPIQQTLPTSTQELETLLHIAKWMVSIITPIVAGLSFAVYRLWVRNNEEHDKHSEELKELWKTTYDAFLEQGKVLERLTNKIHGPDDH